MPRAVTHPPATTGRRWLRSTFLIVSTALLATPGHGLTYTVTTDADSGPGSLRAAIVAANAQSGADVIDFVPSVTGTITLLSALPTITAPVEIQGPGADVLAVSGDDAYDLFDIAPSANDVSVSGLTLRDGRSLGHGGCVHVDSAALKLTGVRLEDCQAPAGGGVYANDSPLTILDSEFFLCRATGGSGGGISLGGLGSPALTVSETLFRAGRATASGGGIHMGASGGSAQIVRSAFVANRADLQGGGLYTVAPTAVENSTFSHNTADLGGGLVTNAQLTLSHVTLVRNRGTTNHGGIFREIGGVVASMSNSILAYNVEGPDTLNESPSDCSADLGIAGGHNLDTDGSCGFTGAGDLGATDPLIGSGKEIDGWSAAFLDVRSPAVDAGAGTACPATDQRGVPRPLDGDLDGSSACDLGAFEARTHGVTHINDSGVGSLRQALVDANAHTERDYVLFTDSFLTGSLDLVALTSPLPAIGGSVVIQGPGLTEGGVDASGAGDRVFPTTTLTTGQRELRILDLTLTGGSSPGAPGGGVLTVQAAESLWIERCHVTGNESAGDGGALHVADVGTVHVRHSVFTGNQATGDGGAIASTGPLSYVTVVTSRLDGNRASGSGGGVYAEGNLIANYASFSSNQAALDGGAVAWVIPSSLFGPGSPFLAASNSTVSGNFADRDGGAFHFEDATPLNDAEPYLDLNGLTIVSNTADADDDTVGSGGGIAGSFPSSAVSTSAGVLYILANSILSNAPDNCSVAPNTDGGHNLSSDASCGFVAPGDLQSTAPLLSSLSAAPPLGSLRPTRFHTPRPGSPAIDGGGDVPVSYPSDPDGCYPWDQTGASRHVDPAGPPSPFLDGDGDGTPGCDIGAIEVLFSSGFESGGLGGWSASSP